VQNHALATLAYDRYARRFDKVSLTRDDAPSLSGAVMRLGVIFAIVLAVILAAVLWRRGKPPVP